MLRFLYLRLQPTQFRCNLSIFSRGFRCCETSKSLTEAGVQKSYKTPDSVTNQAKDIIIYKYDNPKFYKYLNLFALTQFGFWSFLSHSTLSLIDVQLSKEITENKDLPFWQKVNLGDPRYKKALALLYAGIGMATFGAGWVYILRSVRYVILRKDGATAALVTYTPFGKNRIMNVPLNCISAAGSRTSGKSYIPLRLNGMKFFYLLDSKGEFPRPGLFDTTVGVHRKFSKK